MLRWTTHEKVLRVDVVRHWFYLAAKAPGVGRARHCLILSWTSGRWRSTERCVVPGLGYLWRS
jgi:hypothetical protein